MTNSQKKIQKPCLPTINPPPTPHTTQEITDFNRVNFVVVSEFQDGQRLDNFLLARLKGLPRSHVYKLIRDDEIRVNKKRVKPHTRLALGDVVRIAPMRLPSPANPIHVSDELAAGLLGRIIYEDDGLIVLNKPCGMAVHGGSGVSVGVIEAMRVASAKKHLELVHRIDKQTSGLLLIAKKRARLKELQDQFRQKTIKKHYVCLVLGQPNQDKQIIDKPLYKYTLDNGERRVRVDKQGKDSQTSIQVLARFVMDNWPVSLILASPLTGRTHQIRVHLASIGCPLLGDDKYLNQAAPSVGRLCLHAYQLNLPNGQQFIAPIPPDMQALCRAYVGLIS